MISLRLTNDLENKLNKISKTENISKSELIKRALLLYFEKYQKTHSPYDLGKDLFGKYGSGIGTLSKDYKNILKGKLREKHSR
jgi:hypothetical protein